jgi:hypothetical protein
MMVYEELNNTCRESMLLEFESEESGPSPYRGRGLSDRGRSAFCQLMRQAIKDGNESTLAATLNVVSYWNPEEEYVRKDLVRTRRVNVPQATQRLALTEFSTWYVRGLTKRLLDEGVKECQVYRGEQPKWEPGACADHEGVIVSVQSVYDGHRAKYWPEPGQPDVFSIPFGPGCHHIIRRII